MNLVKLSQAAVLTAAVMVPAVSAGQGSSFAAGKWEVTTTIVSVDMPGAPPQVAQMMAGHPTTITQCVTPDMVAKGQVSRPQAGNCTASNSTMAGGKIAISMVCQSNGTTMTINETGSFSGASYNIDAKSTMSGKTSMTQVMKISGKRLGDC